jgi:hypothetical protein
MVLMIGAVLNEICTGRFRPPPNMLPQGIELMGLGVGGLTRTDETNLLVVGWERAMFLKAA